jgi:hypothetical protein
MSHLPDILSHHRWDRTRQDIRRTHGAVGRALGSADTSSSG